MMTQAVSPRHGTEPARVPAREGGQCRMAEDFPAQWLAGRFWRNL